MAATGAATNPKPNDQIIRIGIISFAKGWGVLNTFPGHRWEQQRAGRPDEDSSPRPNAGMQ